jgi:hypothetical protein
MNSGDVFMKRNFDEMKNYFTMKKLILISLFSVTMIAISVTACKDTFLDKKPLGVLSPSVLADAKGVDALLIAAYSELDGWAGWSTEDPWDNPGSSWVYGDVGADDSHKGSDPGDQDAINNIEEHEGLLPTNPYMRAFVALYDGVARANDVLRVVPTAAGIDDATKNKIIAEARFLRGYFHLCAIKIFDYVPYVDETDLLGKTPNQPASSAAGDATKKWSEMGGDGVIPWDKVEADLTFAKDNLDVTPRNNDVGRVTKLVAEAYLAKVKLFRGDFAAALPFLNDIITSGKFSLNPAYQTCFMISGNNSSESVFAIQSSVNDGDGGQDNAHIGEILNFPYNNQPGGCCGFNTPSQDLVNAFKTQNGLPYLQALGLDYHAAGDDVKNDVGLTSAQPFTPDARELDPRLDWTLGRRGIPYFDWGIEPGQDWIRNQGANGPYTPKKLVFTKADHAGGQDAPGNGWGGGASSNKIELVRYADVLLMAAECEVEATNLGQARTYVNMIRARAKDPQSWVYLADGTTPAANYVINTYPAAGAPFDTQANAREAVRFERRIELGMEGLRFWDLKRWGVLKSTLETYWAKEAASKTKSYIYPNKKFDDIDVRCPIYQQAIDRSQGTLKQNPGY